MRVFTTLFTLLLALLFTLQVLASPVFEVSIFDNANTKPNINTFNTRLVKTPPAPLQPHPRLRALHPTMLLQTPKAVSLLVLEPALLALAKDLRVRIVILALVVVF
jgi:glycine cleavage system regulatory protein